MAIVYSNDKVVLSDNKEGEALSEQKRYKNVNVSKIESIPITYTDNGEEYSAVISPRKIADQTRYAIANLLGQHGGEFSFLRPYLEKEIIWTFSAGTAFTDGIRIFMSPVWAWEMLRKGRAVTKNGKFREQYIKDHPADSANIVLNAEQLQVVKFIQFTIIHECYHILYKHAKRAIFKNVSSREEHTIANISMDLEINRDIEGYFPLFDGCTKEIGGIWFQDSKYYKNGKPFNSEAFEEIYDYFLQNKNDIIKPYTPNRTPDPKEDQSTKYSDKFKNGWNDAIKAIKDKNFDPMSVDTGPIIQMG